MTKPPVVLLFAPAGDVAPSAPLAWLHALGTDVVRVADLDELKRRTMRGRPRVVLFDAREDVTATLAACRWLKTDS